MILYDLACPHGHVFEAWFADAAAFQTQQQRGLLRCPICDSGDVEKRLSAKVSTSRTRHDPDANTAEALSHLRAAVQSAEDVGERFADEARKMHYEEIPPRPIRGQASADEAKKLDEEGINFAVVPDFLWHDLS